MGVSWKKPLVQLTTCLNIQVLSLRQPQCFRRQGTGSLQLPIHLESRCNKINLDYRQGHSWQIKVELFCKLCVHSGGEYKLQPGATPTSTEFLCLAFGETSGDVNAASRSTTPSSAPVYSSTASPARHPSALPPWEEGKGCPGNASRSTKLYGILINVTRFLFKNVLPILFPIKSWTLLCYRNAVPI